MKNINLFQSLDKFLCKLLHLEIIINGIVKDSFHAEEKIPCYILNYLINIINLPGEE